MKAIFLIVCGFLYFLVFLRFLKERHQNTSTTEASSITVSNVQKENSPKTLECKQIDIDALEIAAANGDSSACLEIGKYYLLYTEVSLENAEKGVRWLKRAAEQGEAYACCLLGTYYLAKDYEPGHLSRAFYWNQKGADLNDPDCQRKLALMYLTGNGTERDEELAHYWLRKSAEQGDLEAAKALCSYF